VGINTAIISPQIGQGLGFAVPINMAKALIPQLLEGKVARGYVGVAVTDLTPDLAQGFGVPSGTKGALVQNVLAGKPADQAGVKAGDIVVSVDGRLVDGSGPLTRAVSGVRPGAKVKLEVLRNGKKKDLTITVAKRPDEEALASGKGDDEAPPGAEKPSNEKLGIRVAPLSPELARELQVQGDQGVVIVGLTEDGPAEKAGLRRGDLVLEIKDGEATTAVARVEDLAGAVAKSRPGEIVVLRVRRGGQAVFVPVKVGGPEKK